jgi:hypothetical protein
MHNDDNFELSSEERAALASLPREMEPGNLLEAKVLRALREEGHFGTMPRRSNRGVSIAWKIAAGIMLFAGGVATGKYLLASDIPASASVTAPVNDTRGPQLGAPRYDPRPAQSRETVVAEREMWL